MSWTDDFCRANKQAKREKRTWVASGGRDARPKTKLMDGKCSANGWQVILY